MRTGSALRRALAGVATATLLAACTVSGGAGGPEVTLEGFDDAEEATTTTSATTSTTTTAPTLTFEIEPDDGGDWTYEELGEETETPELLGPDAVVGPEACRELAATTPFPDPGRVEPPRNWLDIGDMNLTGEDGLSAYRHGELDRLFTPEGSVDPAGLIEAWYAAGFQDAILSFDEDGEPALYAMVSTFLDHEGAVAATRAHLHDLCESAETSAPLADGTGIRMISIHGPAKIVAVAGNTEVDLTAFPSGLAGPDTIVALEGWLEELYALAGTR